jgi:hypothetical protein
MVRSKLSGAICSDAMATQSQAMRAHNRGEVGAQHGGAVRTDVVPSQAQALLR